MCSVPGSVLGQIHVLGDTWVNANYEYSFSYTWRNLGVLIVFILFFLATYLAATEYNQTTSSTAGRLVFRRGHTPLDLEQTENDAHRRDTEANSQNLVTSELVSLPDRKIMERFVIEPQRRPSLGKTSAMILHLKEVDKDDHSRTYQDAWLQEP